MTDIALIALEAGSGAIAFDLALTDYDIATEEGLNTACYISLFTDRRALEDDALPDGSTDRRGWWGDAFSEVDGDEIGSRLWLISREKLTPETLKRAESYCDEALKWLVEDGVAKSVNCAVTRVDPSIMSLEITITRPDGRVHKYDYIWRSYGVE